MLRRVVYIFLAILIAGCVVKELPEPTKEPGLATIPVYREGTYAFDTRQAIRQLEEKKELERKRREEIKRKIKEAQIMGLEDPWIPPEPVDPDTLPPALKNFPKDTYGYPDWTKAVAEGLLNPRSSVTGDKPDKEPLDLDILFEINDRLMANVLFSHKIHTFWLSCKNCHPKIFKEKKGANNFNMYDIWNGKYCGRCHGKVAFQPKGFENCQRCHSVKKKTMGIK
ncbi:MAG TPA: hypothetical protein ENK42_06075 [Deltaproteobacteria bacterium]|nr:hypothetical protein [Deltaproteobacteria bacterium]